MEVIALLLLLAPISTVEEAHRCYRLEFANLHYGQDGKYVQIKSSYNNLTVANATLDLLLPIKNPTWKIGLHWYSEDKGTVNIFNRTFRVCTMQILARRNPFVAATVFLTKAHSNFTLSCPLLPNTYYIHIPLSDVADQIMLRPFYLPNTLTYFIFTFYEQIPNGNLTVIAFYKIGAVIKRIC